MSDKPTRRVHLLDVEDRSAPTKDRERSSGLQGQGDAPFLGVSRDVAHVAHLLHLFPGSMNCSMVPDS
jgi:hypothetical protein